jgi:spermidine/putrescine-binding protein
MNRLATFAAVAFAATAFALAGSAFAAKDQLHLYNWNNYIAPETIKRFEQSCGCEVVQLSLIHILTLPTKRIV